MQRQSLGSPLSKLQPHGGATGAGARTDILMSDDAKRKDLPSPCSATDEDRKAAKPRRFSASSSSSLSTPLPSSAHPKPEKLIHLIPLLTLLCFLVLFLVSHDPSQSDLAHFKGFKIASQHIESSEFGDVSRFTELRRGDVFAIRSLRNLQETTADSGGASPKSRSHRKIADF